MSGRGWLAWFLAWFGVFLFFEIRALATGHAEKTLSAAIWRFEQFRTGQPLYQWSAGHFLFIGILGVVLLWMLLHFAFGIFT